MLCISEEPSEAVEPARLGGAVGVSNTDKRLSETRHRSASSDPGIIKKIADNH